MRIVRVFPRRTNATPDDNYAFIGEPPLFIPPFDEVHVDVTFTWDIPAALNIAKSWERFGKPVKIGGVAMGTRGEEFKPGIYLKPGYVITSRGCPNKCWFCTVWKRGGVIRELPIIEGWNVLDDNLLACSEKHILTVFDMLKSQPHAPEFTGGLDPRYMTVEIMREIKALKPKQIFTAYDSEDDKPFVEAAISNCWKAGFTKSPQSHAVRCFVLIGFPRDIMEKATERLRWILELGAFPMAMLYRDQEGKANLEWRRFQRRWANPISIGALAKEVIITP